LGEYYLVPWILLTTVVLTAPSMFLIYQGKFDPFHPLVFPVWTYMLLAFVGGGWILTFKLTDFYFYSFIEYPEYDLPLSLIYVCIGFLGLVAGYYVPFTGKITSLGREWMPKWGLTPKDLIWPGMILVFLGIGLNVVGLLQGVLGFQRVDEVGLSDAVIAFTSRFFLFGFLMLWMVVFSFSKRTPLAFAITALLVVLIPLNLVLQGNRSGLLSAVLPIGVAYWYSGRRIRWTHAGIFGGLLVLALVAGIIYGTTFRSIKGTESRVEGADYVEQVFATLEYLADSDPNKLIAQAGTDLAERVENLSSLAVVVSNYEKLEPYEASYGIDNNITREFFSAFVPRVIWPEKPVLSNARAYSDLYFGYGENSFAITVFGDLLRNYGPVGVPLGMVVLGLFLRLIYDVFIASPGESLWRPVIYYAFLSTVSYEGFYSIIFPSILRTFFIILIVVLLLFIFRGRPSYNPIGKAPNRN